MCQPNNEAAPGFMPSQGGRAAQAWVPEGKGKAGADTVTEGAPHLILGDQESHASPKVT